MSDFKKKAVNSIKWTSLRTVLAGILGPLLLIVKSRYLSPSEFGVLAIVTIFITILNVIENFGFGTAVIQKDNVTYNERSSLFSFQLLFCVVIGLLMIVTSPIFAAIFDMESLRFLLSLLSIVVFINGPVILFSAFLEKEFKFKELSLIQIVRETALFGFTTLFLVTGMGLTGVVLGQITAIAVMAVLVLIVSYKEGLLHLKFRMKVSEIKFFLKFGLFIVGRQLLVQLTHHIDELIIGIFLPAQTLGYYHFAKNYLSKFRVLVTTAFAKVLLPVLSKVKRDTRKLTYAYNNISKYVAVFSFPVFAGLALTAHLYIPVLFGEQWLPTQYFFVILAFAYIPYILTANLASSLLYAVNKPNMVLKVDIITNSIYIGLLLIISWMEIGIYPIVILYAVYLTGNALVFQNVVSKYLHHTFGEYMTLFKNTVIATAFMAATVLGTQYFSSEIGNLVIELLLSIAVGAISYLAIYYVINKSILFEMKELILNR